MNKIKVNLIQIDKFGIFRENETDKDISKYMTKEGYEIWIETPTYKIWRLKNDIT